MRISAKAEYACVAMLELAASYRDPQPMRIKTIAESHGISQRFLVQILLQLKTAGLVSSVRGASGGYQLARPPESVTLSDVIGAIEKHTLAPTSALTVANRTPKVETLLAVWREVQAEEQRLLKSLSLAELLRRSQQGSGLSYEI